MRRPLLAAFAAILALSACGNGFSGRLNPFNWGKHRAASAGAEDDVLTPPGGYPSDALLQAPMVERVLSMKVEPTTGGIVIHATGLPPTQGFWYSRLIATNDGAPDDKGTVTYRFVLFPPKTPQPVSTQRSREVTAGAFIATEKMGGIRRIVIEGRTNSLSARR